jgi:TusA-related sulfurtransferase
VFGSSPPRSDEIAAGEVFYTGATTMATEAAIDKELNLQGEVCPYTFVKSKLALEIMQPGQVLRVTVDNDESAANVPRSMQNEGHDVLGVTKLNDKDWQIVVRKS